MECQPHTSLPKDDEVTYYLNTDSTEWVEQHVYNLHCHLQDMKCQLQTFVPKENEVTHYVNRDSTRWVKQHVRMHMYIELKLECTRNRSRDVNKAKDDWLCLYCRGSFLIKLRLADQRVRGCPCGLVDSNGSRW